MIDANFSCILQVTTLIQKLNVKHSTFVLLMELEVSQNTASCVPMELCSTRTTSSVTGGSTLIVPLLRTSTASMMKLLLKEMLLLELLTRLNMELLHKMHMLLQPLLHQHMMNMLLLQLMMNTLNMMMLLLVVMRLRLKLQ